MTDPMHCNSFSLTVAEGKRLIARGVAALPCVKNALQEGIVVVTRSTTSGYVLEELVGREVDRASFLTGRTLPSSPPEAAKRLSGDIGSAVFVGGELREEMEIDDALEQMKAGDVIIKSPNALDHARGVVGYLIGHPTGGTVGATLGAVHGSNFHLVAPVGLEKQVAGELVAASARVTAAGELRKGPGIWVTPAEIVTELEALTMLAGVEALQIGAGGIMGAEGAAWITVCGSEEQIAAAMEVVAGVRGEPSMLDYVEGRQ